MNNSNKSKKGMKTMRNNVIKLNNKRKVRKVEHFLQNFCSLRKNEQRKFLRDCHENMICCISEACYNLLKNIHLKDDKKVVVMVNPIRGKLEKLWCEGVTCERRREILTSAIGDKIFVLLKVVLLPFLTDLLK